MARITDKEIRECFGHNGVECVVRIKRNGEVYRYGSPDPFDRSEDYWHYLGTRERAVREIEAAIDAANEAAFLPIF